MAVYLSLLAESSIYDLGGAKALLEEGVGGRRGDRTADL
jgi:hypothetical protein